jgi:hypothetical protein
VSTQQFNSQAAQIGRTIKLLPPRILALAFAVLFEIAEAFFGPRHRRFLDALARRTADLYAAAGPTFRKRLDKALGNRRLAPVDWREEEPRHGS